MKVFLKKDHSDDSEYIIERLRDLRLLEFTDIGVYVGEVSSRGQVGMFAVKLRQELKDAGFGWSSCRSSDDERYWGIPANDCVVIDGTITIDTE